MAPLLALLGLNTLSLMVLWTALYRALASAERGTANRARLAGFLYDRTLAKVYRRALASIERAAHAFYGPAHSLRALRTSIAIAAVYPSLFFFLSYAVGGLHSLAGIPLHDPPPQAAAPWGQLVGDLAFLGTASLLFLRRQRLDRWVADWTDGRSATWTRAFLLALASAVALATLILSQLIYFFVGSFGDWSMTLALALIASLGLYTAAGTRTSALGACAVFVNGAIAVRWAPCTIGLLGLGCILFRRLGAGLFLALAAAVGAAGIADVASAGMFSDGKLDDRAVSGALMLAALPIVNGILDWISLRISRHFIRQARDSSDWATPFQGVFLDALSACGLLVLLALLLPAVVDGVALLPARTVVMDWHETGKVAQHDPWGKGLVVTLMLVSTLAPTAVHVLVGVSAVAVHLLPTTTVLNLLRTMDDPHRVDHRNNFDPALVATLLVAYLTFAMAILYAALKGLHASIKLPLAAWLYHIAAKKSSLNSLAVLPFLLLFGAWRWPARWLRRPPRDKPTRPD